MRSTPQADYRLRRWVAISVLAVDAIAALALFWWFAK